MPEKLSCPACGAPLTIQNRFVKLVTCDFCQQVSLVHDQGLDPTGQTAKLIEIPSMIYVDAIGSLSGRRFSVVGRLRYQYTDGQWDEWFLVFEDGEPAWLVEDEGEFALYSKAAITGPAPEFETTAVGTTISVSGRTVYVTEKGRAEYAGSEGQLAFTAVPGQRVRYLDGNSGAELISLEYTEDEIELSVGRTVSAEELEIDENE